LSFFKKLQNDLDLPLLNEDNVNRGDLKGHEAILLEGERVSIYEDRVSFQDIIAYFMSAMPWLKISIKEIENINPTSLSFSEYIDIKEELFLELTVLLEDELSHFFESYSTGDLTQSPIPDPKNATKH
tara:strand:- start:594 stop:977 length:384 start_codon:yes stop_codon:yes gene_type:complete